MRCRAENLHATRRQVDDKHRVIRHQAAPRPHFRREEICAGNRAPMCPQKRLPRGRPLRHRRHARRFQHPRDRRPTDPMPHVLQRALDPRVAPGGVLPRHADDEPADLCEHAAPTRPGRRVRPLAGDQLSVPAEQRVRSDDRGDLAQRPTAHPEGPHGEAPSVAIVRRKRRRPSCRRKRRFSSMRYASASRSRRSSQPVSTISSIWNAEASITSASLYHRGRVTPSLTG